MWHNTPWCDACIWARIFRIQDTGRICLRMSRPNTLFGLWSPPLSYMCVSTLPPPFFSSLSLSHNPVFSGSSLEQKGLGQGEKYILHRIVSAYILEFAHVKEKYNIF
jgi:hypothetical protein